MASSVWNSVQVPTSGMVSVVSAAGGDPASMLNTQLANALSTMGDSQYWEESIAPSTIRTSLATTDPSHAHATPTLLRAMKWLLASISKGRNVSDFYPHVVKLVGVPSLEVRKMVYMYLVQYADHDATTRELSLLSINSFQRGLADNEAMIRAIALRVLTSIRVPDILQIQILGVQKCASDKSPYVRKCAANALAKLHDQCATDVQQQIMLLDIMQQLLDDDDQTMVLTSAVIAFSDLCPQKLALLHGCFRKLCNLLADMDEWGQVVVIDVLARYCRQFFAAPRGTGSAEAIDAERRIVRTLYAATSASSAGLDALVSLTINGNEAPSSSPNTNAALPPRTGPRKIIRRVVKKGFYSDEEDASTEEEVYAATPSGAALPVSSAMRERSFSTPGMTGNTTVTDANDLEDEDLDEDHRLLLRSTLPLLKSRNAGVVLAVCSLHYYCGVASIRVRSSLGKAMVRIHRDRREIQYAVLTSIHSLVKECPSAFTPFLHDFYVKAMDPSFTRLLKLDILTLLALEPASIESVLKELRTYIRHDDDKIFCCASIRAVGKVAELARVVHDRHAQNKSGNLPRERKEANRVALNALYGLLTLTRASSDSVVVGECAIVMERILLQLLSNSDGVMAVDDPNRIQEHTIKKLLLLLISSLSSRSLDDDKDDDKDDDEEEGGAHSVLIPPLATAATLWIVGEWLVPTYTFVLAIPNFDNQARIKTRLELVRLIARSYPSLEPVEKLQSIHFVSKLLVSSVSPKEAAVCEHVLSLGRAEVQPDVRDRARMESNLLHTSRGLQYDVDNLAIAGTGKTLAVDQVKKVLLSSRPPSSALPLLDEQEVDGNVFRFGTLSSLVNRKAKAAYLPLPNWAGKNSPSTLRDDKKFDKNKSAGKSDSWNVDSTKKAASGFYDSEASTDEDDSSNDDDSESDDSDDNDDSSEWDSDDESDDADNDSDDSSEDSDDIVLQPPAVTSIPQPLVSMNQPMINLAPMISNAGGPSLLSTPINTTALMDHEEIAEEDESSDWDEDSDDDDSDDEEADKAPTSNLLGMSQPQPNTNNLLGMTQPQPAAANLLSIMQPQPAAVKRAPSTNSTGAYAEGLEGLVMAPVVVNVEESADPDIDRDSSAWMDLVRHELGGGLSVKARYLRGPTRDREAQLIGLDPSSPAVVLYQLQFQNKRTDRGVLRRVRIVGRTTTSGHVGPARTVIPPEIVALAKGQMAIAVLGMVFASVSDREGNLQARFDLKSDRGSTALDLRPPLGELVQPLKISTDAFEKGMKRLQGFQRVTSKFTVAAVDDLDRAVLKQVALQPLDIKTETWKESRRLRLMGNLPASEDKLYIVVQCKDGRSGTFTVCCDNAMATNSILDTLKVALKP